MTDDPVDTITIDTILTDSRGRVICAPTSDDAAVGRAIREWLSQDRERSVEISNLAEGVGHLVVMTWVTGSASIAAQARGNRVGSGTTLHEAFADAFGEAIDGT